jgi:hypothetical protein
MKYVVACLTVLLAVSIAASALAQTPTAGESTKLPDDPNLLRELRGKLASEIRVGERALLDLRRKRSDAELLQQSLSRARNDLAKARAAQPANPAYIRDIEDFIKGTEERQKGFGEVPLAKLADDIQAKEFELEQKRERLSDVETKLNFVLTRDAQVQSFKREVSIVFSVLVGLVILGFFVIAFVDEGVRQTIFSGTSGIQFVTLFSLVIAIILFGVTGILEGKELAALLGGLSGYILGRATSERSSASVPRGERGAAAPAARPGAPPAGSQAAAGSPTEHGPTGPAQPVGPTALASASGNGPQGPVP